MKKYLLIIFVFVLGSFLMSGCVASFGGIMSGSAALSSNNFKFVKLAQGEAKTTSVFGIGGTGKNALVADAKANLIQKNPLKEGQTLANVCVDFKHATYLIVNVSKVTITADIVEFK
jgi:hypothetical protein